jgi:hypothetical protein
MLALRIRIRNWNWHADTNANVWMFIELRNGIGDQYLTTLVSLGSFFPWFRARTLRIVRHWISPTCSESEGWRNDRWRRLGCGWTDAWPVVAAWVRLTGGMTSGGDTGVAGWRSDRRWQLGCGWVEGQLEAKAWAWLDGGTIGGGGPLPNLYSPTPATPMVSPSSSLRPVAPPLLPSHSGPPLPFLTRRWVVAPLYQWATPRSSLH